MKIPLPLEPAIIVVIEKSDAGTRRLQDEALRRRSQLVVPLCEPGSFVGILEEDRTSGTHSGPSSMSRGLVHKTPTAENNSIHGLLVLGRARGSGEAEDDAAGSSIRSSWSALMLSRC